MNMQCRELLKILKYLKTFLNFTGLHRKQVWVMQLMQMQPGEQLLYFPDILNRATLM